MAKSRKQSEYRERITHMVNKHLRWAGHGVILSDEALSEGLKTTPEEIAQARREAELV